MKRGNVIRLFRMTLLCGVAALSLGCRARHDDALREAFDSFPLRARPMVWWHWMNGNISQEGARKDILWMDSIGLGGFHLFDAGLDIPQVVDERIGYMSPEWKTIYRESLALADSLGMEVAVSSSPGWSSTGGPWVRPEDAMKKLVWRVGSIGEAFRVSSRFQNVPLPVEYNHHQDGPIKESYYEDIAAYAVRMPSDYETLEQLGARVSSSGGHFELASLTDGDLTNAGVLPAGQDGYAWIQYEFPHAQSFKAVTVVNAKARTGGHALPAFCRDSLQVSDDGIHFRTLCGITVGAAQQQTETIPFAEARFWRLKIQNASAVFHYGKLVSSAPPGTEIGDFILHRHCPVNHYEEKAGFGYTCDLHRYPTPADAQPCSVIRITDSLGGWVPPDDGQWIVYRFGYSLTGKKNHPASPDATGLEVDKLDTDAFMRYLRTYIDMHAPAIPQYLMIDSYEAGAQNWTRRLPDEFARRRGYDLMDWLPAVAGIVIGSVEETERFLWDFRRTIGELFAENYAAASDLVRNEYGMKGLFIESHEHGRSCPADGMSIKKTAAYPMSAMWLQVEGTPYNREAEGKADIRESASVAHIYGQNLVAAESFTVSGANGRAYSFFPGNLKRSADLEIGAGVNRFVIHESAHQPVDSLVPGIGLGPYGQWFNRQETWAGAARPWIEYLTRSCAVLQQGRYVADYLYYYGEDTNVTAQFSREEVPAPFGYGYDFIGPEALLDELKVRKGKLSTRSGMEYPVLFIGGEGLPMSPEVRNRIDAFKKAGVRVLEGVELSRVGEALSPDLALSEEDEMQFVHRRTSYADIYWISNVSGRERTVNASFRLTGRKPRLWHPETGTISDLPYRIADGRTTIPLHFDPVEAYFVVFEEAVTERSLSVPGKVVTAEKELIPVMEPWNLSEDPELRYFSGTKDLAVDFEFIPDGSSQYVLDLGAVYNIAEVRLNDVRVGQAWKYPYRLDITDYLIPGKNKLTISVTNLWVNRLIGDTQPSAKKSTYTSVAFFKAGGTLLPSGLVGPVKLVSINTTPRD